MTTEWTLNELGESINGLIKVFNPEVKFVKVEEDAKIPTKGKTNTDTGMDVWCNSTETIMIRPCSRQFFKTGIAAILPDNWALTVADRSGVGSKGIKYLAGEIDNQYRGTVGIILANINSDKAIIFSHQTKEEVEKATWFDIACGEFITDGRVPCDEDILNYKVLRKEVLVIRYLSDAIAQLKMTLVPNTTIVEGTLEELALSIETSKRKADGYGSTDGK